mmetsp:Transcript_30699/g.44644  ORF Transcript_30699/g.44644 Transcript_30699/m.44644 type:complete len:215 (+) Transcript_30699:599-1243(+)
MGRSCTTRPKFTSIPRSPTPQPAPSSARKKQQRRTRCSASRGCRCTRHGGRGWASPSWTWRPTTSPSWPCATPRSPPPSSSAPSPYPPPCSAASSSCTGTTSSCTSSALPPVSRGCSPTYLPTTKSRTMTTTTHLLLPPITISPPRTTTDSRHSPISILVACWETSSPYPADCSSASTTCSLKSPLKHSAADGMSTAPCLVSSVSSYPPCKCCS